MFTYRNRHNGDRITLSAPMDTPLALWALTSTDADGTERYALTFGLEGRDGTAFAGLKHWQRVS